MKIGYPCINTGIGCTANSTFRLRNYSEENLIKKVTNNLQCMQKILEYNLKNNLLFFRISSDLVPFASHPVNKFNWQDYFKKDFEKIGSFIKKHDMRISMHPDQFVLLNSNKEEVVEKSIKDLQWHAEVLDLMKLDTTEKIQIHVGGVYGNKEGAIERFIHNFNKLPQKIKRRLAIENDDRLYSLKDCLEISENTQIPIIFDTFHHECLNNGEPMRNAIKKAQKTWKRGLLMIDYSSQQKDARKGKHTEHIDIEDFRKFLGKTKGLDFDIMLEIKDKENSALKAVEEIR